MKVESLAGGRIDHDRCAFIDEDTHGLLARSQLSAGDVLFSIAGTLGRTALVTVQDLPANTNQAVAIVRPTAAVDGNFLQLCAQHRAASLGDELGGRGVGLQNLNLAQLGALDVPLPPMNEQRRIVAKLDALLARSKKAREHLDRIPALLDALKRSILAAAFRGDLTADWRKANPDVEPATKLLGRIRAERRRRWEEELRAKGKDPKKAKYEEPAPVAESELPELPEGWCWAPLGALVNQIDTGKNEETLNREPEGDEHAVVKVSAVTGGAFDATAAKAIKPERFLSSAAIRRGDLLLARANGTLSMIGAAVLVEEDHTKLMLPDKILRLHPNGAVERRFLLHSLRSREARDFIEQNATGIDVRNISQAKLVEVPIALPPLEEQRRVMSLLDGLLAGCQALKLRSDAQARALATLESSTLGAAFRGELVPQDPNDEPADAMLARLRAATPTPAAKAPRAKRPAAAAQEAAPSMGDALDVVVGALVAAKRMTAEQVRAATGLGKDDVTPVLKGLVAAGKVRVEGKARGTAYVWAG
ncbi:MAG: restriction endonuclease subunit S [Deltaproteobacteria bacterium]|nr:restriction endonuclease subunit S [Deltaproteobacteria bacterium]